jgi:hypothetical protein
MNEEEEFEFRLRLESEAGAKPAPTFGQMFKDEILTSLPGGLARGVKDVIDTGAGFISRLGGSGEAARVKAMNDAGKAEFTQAQENVGAGGSGVARIGGQILATSPVGPILGAGAKAAGLTRFGNALTTGGMTTGAPAAATFGGRAADMGIRMGAGAVTGGAMAGLVNPDDAATGAVIGAVLPPAIKAAGAAGQAVLKAWTSARTPRDVKMAQQMAQQIGVTADDLKAATTGPQMIPGYQPTVPQIVQNPVASQLQRTLKTAGGDALGNAERTQQAQFRAALDRIAPMDNTVQDAANRAGGAIQDFAIPAERQAGQRVNALFDAIPEREARMQLPIARMEAARDRFLGPGTFGKGGGAADAAIEEAMAIGTRPAPAQALDYSSSDLARRAAGGHAHGAAGPTVQQAVPFNQLQKLRSSIGEAITDAQANGRNQAAAALTEMKNAIDNKVADVAAGNALPGEVFTPQAIDTWGQALQAHAGKQRQFHTGPQVGLFRRGGDGQAAVQGAEIPGKFFNGNRSQVEDAQAFRRLIGDRQDLAQELKRFALTEGAATSNAGGDLTSKFVKWAESRSGGIRELFSPQEVATIREVSKAVERGMSAENLGRVTNSDTMQKMIGMQRNGLLDSKVVDVLANRIPGIGAFTGPMLTGLRNTATTSKQAAMANLLSDPAAFESALRQAPVGKGLLNFAPELSLLTQGVYRSAPLLGGSR